MQNCKKMLLEFLWSFANKKNNKVFINTIGVYFKVFETFGLNRSLKHISFINLLVLKMSYKKQMPLQKKLNVQYIELKTGNDEVLFG